MNAASSMLLTVAVLRSPDLYSRRGFGDNGPLRVGYARVSRQDQRPEPQRDTLLADGCGGVFEDKVFSREAERKALREAFAYCREGDVLVVARLDRLGRSLRTDRPRRGAGGEGCGIPARGGGCGHEYGRWEADRPRRRGPGGVREGNHPRKDGGRARFREGPRVARRQAEGAGRRQG